jgi:hypothetical protein
LLHYRSDSKKLTQRVIALSVHTHSSPTILHARLALAQPSSTVARVMLCNMYADAIRLCLSLMPQSSPNRRTAPSPQMEILLPALDESIENTARAIVFTLMSRIDTLHEGRNRHPHRHASQLERAAELQPVSDC